EDLRFVGLGVVGNLLAGERRARSRAAGGIADHAGEIADEEDDGVAEILKMFELAQQDGMAEVEVGSSRIEARLHPQRLAGSERAFELGAQFGFLDDLGRALLDVSQLFVNRGKVCHVVVIITISLVESGASRLGLRWCWRTLGRARRPSLHWLTALGRAGRPSLHLLRRYCGR